MATSSMCIVLLVCFICHLELTCASQHEINKMLLAKIEALEKQGQTQTARIAQLEGDLRLENEHVRHQDGEMEKLRGHVRRQDETIQQLLWGGNQPDGAPATLQKSGHTAAEVQSLLKAKSRQSRLVLDQSETVVFFAQIAQQSLDHIAVNQTVIFEKANVNLGGGYDTHTGVFTAPRPGIYLLATSFVSYLQHHHEIHLSLRKNGQELSKVVAHGDSGHLDQGSTTIVTTLNNGDRLYLANIGDPDNSLGGSGYSNFMGVLLYEL